MNVSVILLAAGRGERMGGGEKKIYRHIAGTPLLAHTIRAFARYDQMQEMVLVVRAGEEDRVLSLLPPGLPAVKIVPGGDSRRESSLAGVEAAGGEILLIHDAARPFPSLDLINRVVEATILHDACIPVLPVVDTLRACSPEGVLSRDPIDRSRLVRIQTPQGFRAALIRRCLAQSRTDITDDAAAVLACGEPVWSLPGESTNLKVTLPADLPFATAIYRQLHESDAI